MNKRQLYWFCQILGWFFYGSLQIFLYSISKSPDLTHIFGEVLQVLFYIATTHFIRYSLIYFGWLELSMGKMIARTFIVIPILSLLNFGFLISFSYFTGELTSRDFQLIPVFLNVFGPMIIYIIWSIIYLSFHYFERYNNSLKYEAAAREIELRNLRSQLNPHFIFNALNSIRALVDEEPVKSKIAITKLSNILRNSLMVDRQKLVSLGEELETVKDYLDLEAIRYEERLKVSIEADPGAKDFLIPPLMVQTLVENGIKHGISMLKSGGFIRIKCEVQNNALRIQIRNSGRITEPGPVEPSGFGISNTKKRLELIYGDQATFFINNENPNTVLTEITIPQTL